MTLWVRLRAIDRVTPAIRRAASAFEAFALPFKRRHLINTLRAVLRSKERSLDVHL